ncbi:MAG: acyl-CoA dehydrogenase [Actinomycetia bacterium]|nr:acyl-CoA dehydrogenase [Actinomycetes bacterium]
MSDVTEAEVVERVLDWFPQAWDPDLSLIDWRERLVDSGWAVPSWSSEWYGQDLPAWADGVAHSTIRRAGGVGVPLGGGMGLAAPTMYDHASDDLKERMLRPTLTGELAWCQLFSEPVAGSDLAGLKTTAVLDGDSWVLNGQKVWNTSAHHADMGILVARTDWDAVKHAGITYFVIDMHQPGVEARPIEQMNYHSSFNEVFLTDAVVPVDQVVGEVGGGWRVARATLAHERSFSTRRSTFFSPDASGRVIDEARAEAAEYLKTYEWYPQRMGRVDLVEGRAQAGGRSEDAVVRQGLMDVVSLQRASEWTANRAKAARELGHPPGSEGSIGKLALSEIARRANRVHTTIVGAQGMLRTGPDPLDEVVAEVLISTPAQSIAGGTDEIQHNILGENILGLPKEPAVDRGIPFRDVGQRGGS